MSSPKASSHEATDDDHISSASSEAHGNADVDLEKHPELSTSTNIETQSTIARVASHAIQRAISRSRNDDQAPPPDGGFRAWACCIMTHLFLLFFLGILAGRLTDAGYFHQVFFTGSCLIILGIFTTSVATTYWQVLLAQGLCMGIGGGLVFTSALSVVGTYFDKRRPLALGIVAMANSDGALVYAAVLQQLLPKIGFAWTMRVVGLMLLVSLGSANFLIRPRQLKRSRGPIVEWAAFKEAPYRYFTIGMFMIFLGTFFPVYYIGSYGRSIIQISSTDASSLILIINGVGLASRIPAIYIANKFTGPLNLMLPFVTSSTVVLFSWIAVRDRTGLFIWDTFYGLFMAGFQTLFPAAIGSLIYDVTKMGIRNGMVLSIVSFAFLTGPPLGGALIQRDNGGYLFAQIFTGLCFVVGLTFLVTARFCKVGLKIAVRA